jgi:DNA excision repair protein ERCC-5
MIRTLAQRGEKEQIVDNTQSKREINSTVFRSNPTGSSRATKPCTGKRLSDFGPDVETYRDERGRIRVSRVRAMGIRMTRDIQRNLDFIKENEQVKSRIQTNVHKGSTVSEETPDFPEHLFESNKFQNSISLDEDFLQTAEDNHQTSSPVRGSNNISESSCYRNKETIEISFMDDQTEVKDNYDDIFLHLASGTTSNLFADNGCLAKNMEEESEGSECIWEEGIIEGETLPMKFGEKDNSSVPENCSNDEVEWEEGGRLVPGVASSSEYNNAYNVPKGDLEEEALVQEAMRRSLEDFDKQASENVSTGNTQASVEDRSLQFSDDGLKISEAPVETTSHYGAALVKETNEESRTEINSDENDVVHGTGQIGTYRQENENQPQLVNNEGHDMHRAHLLESLPRCSISTSNLEEKTSDSSKANFDNVMISRAIIPETHVDDHDMNMEQNSKDSNKSKCSQDVGNIEETLKSPQTDLLVDEPDTTESKENATKGDLKVSTSEINYTQVGDNDDNYGISATYLDEELSRLRQEQVDLGHERRKLESHAESVSSEMFAECQVCPYFPLYNLIFLMQSL